MLYIQWLDTFWGAKYVDCPVYNVLIKHGLFEVIKTLGGKFGVMSVNYDNFNDSIIWDTYEDVLADLRILYGGYKRAAITDTHKMVLERTPKIEK